MKFGVSDYGFMVSVSHIEFRFIKSNSIDLQGVYQNKCHKNSKGGYCLDKNKIESILLFTTDS